MPPAVSRADKRGRGGRGGLAGVVPWSEEPWGTRTGLGIYKICHTITDKIIVYTILLNCRGASCQLFNPLIIISGGGGISLDDPNCTT